MPPEASQNFSSHRRYYPIYHFVALPILAINLIVWIVVAVRYPGSWMNWWQVLVAFALAGLTWAARFMVLRVQDRLMRLEETLRLQRLLPDDLRARLGELSTGQLIALRFCCDTEIPELTRAVLTEPIHSREEVKKRIRTWRADAGPRA
jgi:hypothetical protein